MPHLARMSPPTAQEETIKNGTTIVYATHIFGGLDDWGTHIAFLGQRRLKSFDTFDSCADLVVRVQRSLCTERHEHSLPWLTPFHRPTRQLEWAPPCCAQWRDGCALRRTR